MKTTHTSLSRKPAHILAGSIFALFALPVQAAPLITDGLKGYWSFDTDTGAVVAETSGAAGGPYNGNMVGTPAYSTNVPPGFEGPIGGPARQSANMTAGGTGVVVSTDGGNNTYFAPGSAYSVSYWTTGNIPEMWTGWVNKDGDGPGGFRIISVGSNNMGIGMRNGLDSCWPTPTILSPAQTNWVHYAVTFGGGFCRIYQNGIKIAEQARTGTVSPTKGALTFGCSSNENAGAEGAPNGFARVKLDEVYFFNRALTPAEVTTLYGAMTWDGGIGNWADSKWSGGNAPVAARNMAIDAASADSIVALADDFSSASLLLGATNASTLTINSTKTLTLTAQAAVGAVGTLQVDGTLTAGSLSIATGGTATVGATGTLNATSLTTAGNLTVTAGGTVAVNTVTFMPGNVTSGTLNAPGGYATGAQTTVTVGANLTGAGGFTPMRFGGLAILTGTNTYSGPTCTNDWQMYVRANDGTSLSPNTNLRINRQAGFQTGVDLVRPGGTGAGQMQLQCGIDEGAGFTAVGGPVKVCFGSSLASPEALTWNSGFFFPDGGGTTSAGGMKGLYLNGAHVGTYNTQGTHPIEFVNPINLGTIPDPTRWGRVISVTTQSAKMSGVLSGQRGLRKRNGGELILAAKNTYTGDTLISEGKLTLADDAQLRFVIPATSDSGHNTLTGGGAAQLDGDFCIDTTLTDASALVTGTWQLENVGSLPGAYGATFQVVDLTSTPWTNSGAAEWTKTVGNKFYTFNETTGTLTLSEPPSAYVTWATTNVGGEPSDQDFNKDSVVNGVAFFMNKTGIATNPVLNGTTLKVTWPNGGNLPSSAYGTEFVVQTSSNLLTWDDVPVGELDSNTEYSAGPPAVDGELSYTLTGPSPRFVRLKVTPR